MLEPEAIVAAVSVLGAVKPKATSERIEEVERQAMSHHTHGKEVLHHYKHTSTQTEEEDYSTRHATDKDTETDTKQQSHRTKWWQIGCFK